MSDGQGFQQSQGQSQNQNQNGNQSSQGQNGNQNQQSQGQSGSDQFVSKTDFDLLAAKLDDVLADNARYRQQNRSKGANGGANGNQGVSQSGDSNAGNSDLEKRVNDLTAKLTQANFRNDLSAAATRAGAHDPGDVATFISMDSLNPDDNGNVKPADADKAIAALKKTKPYLFGAVVQGGADGGAGNGSNGSANPNDMNSIIRGELRRK